MHLVYLSLGSNIGDKKQNLKEALDYLKNKITISKVSSFYETEPVGYKEQEWFLNIVIEGTTSLSPKELLDFCQSVEHTMKRIKTIRFGPRIIDVDILLYQDVEMNEEILTIPHPRMKERAFVLVPLYELAPDLIIQGESIKAIMNQLDAEQIRKLEYDNGESQ